MIGYYVHHVGRGHLHHAFALAAHLDEPVTILSSLPRSPLWQGDWVELDRDDSGTSAGADAHGLLHWAPLHHRGLRRRMSALAAWVEAAAPSVMVVDVSVEIVSVVRLLGVPVVTFCLPGVRVDPAHQLAFGLADTIIAPWPARFAALCTGLDPHREKVCFTGAFSRFDTRPGASSPRRARHGLVLGGLGGPDRAAVPRAAGWTWTVLAARSWRADPWPELCSADVVVTHAGLGALGEVAAARAPAVVCAQPRPYDEQEHTARALGEAGLAVVANGRPDEWAELLDRASRVGGDGWRYWSDGCGAERAARAVERAAARGAACASR